MLKNVCQTYLKGLKEFHFKLFLALALASGATKPRLGVSTNPPKFFWEGDLVSKGVAIRIVRFLVRTPPGAQPHLGTQTCYEAPGDLWVENREKQGKGTYKNNKMKYNLLVSFDILNTEL